MLRSKWLAALAVGIATIAMGTMMASAHYLTGTHWDHSNILYRDITSEYSNEVYQAVTGVGGGWNNIDDNPTTLTETTQSNWDIQVADYDFGDTDWDGRCSGTAWEEVYVDLNEYYIEGGEGPAYGYYKIRAVVTHEFGHCAGGLDHHEATGRIMQECSCHYYDDGFLYFLDTGTVNGTGELNDLWS